MATRDEAQAAIQSHICAQEDEQAILYAKRSLVECGGRHAGPADRDSLPGVHRRQLERGLAAAERVLRFAELEIPTWPHALLEVAHKAAKQDVKAARDARTRTGSPAQLRLALRAPLEHPSTRVAQPSRARYVDPTLTRPRPLRERPRLKEVPAMPNKKKPAKKVTTGPELMAAVLEKIGRPAHHSIVTAEVLKIDRRKPKAKRIYNGATPEQTISASLTVSHVKGGTFVKTEPGVFALRAWKAPQKRRAALRPDQKARGRQAVRRAAVHRERVAA